jgi:ADP-ribose pyrophosphatase YjhB (NUDIX family)
MPTDREYPARPIVGVGAVILVSPDEARAMGWAEPCEGMGIVLVKRRFEPLAGQWSLPGGTLEVGETLTTGIAREVEEETGLTVDVGAMIDVFDRIFLDGGLDEAGRDDAGRDQQPRVKYHFVLIDYVCRPTGGQLRAGSDVGDVTIAAPDDLARYALTAKTLDVIQKARASRKGTDGYALA